MEAEVVVFAPKATLDGPAETRFLTNGNRVLLEYQPRRPMSSFATVLKRVINRLEEMLWSNQIFQCCGFLIAHNNRLCRVDS
jgi:hypothetical protein